jgi:hypothetical protein
MCQEGEMMVQLTKWSGKAPPGETKGRDGVNKRSSQNPHDGCCPKKERDHPLKFPTGERETKPWETGGGGARMYATIKEVLRVSPLEDKDGASRRSRPAMRPWSGSQSTLMIIAVIPPALQYVPRSGHGSWKT